MTASTTVKPTDTASATSTAISFDGVAKRFSTGTQALLDTNLSVQSGEFVSVVGPSGCGKSTLLRLASGLSRPSAGEITLSSDRLAYVFQDATLLAWRSARANVELVGELHGLSKSERSQKARAALAKVGLAGAEDQLPAQLSGGMRMRVSLARSLILEPDIFLFDEPFGALDEITRLNMQDELQRLLYGGSFSGLFITHSVSEAVYLSNRVLVMSARPGRIVCEIDVPFSYPRPPELRYQPEFGRIAGQVSAALTDSHS